VNAGSALIIAVCIVIETVEQLLFRMAGRHAKRYFFYAVPGAAAHITGLAIWLLALKLIPLGVAMPFMGAAYVTIALVSRALFGEVISKRRWLGIALVVAGVVLLGGIEP
jgi:multidrug transporter EmrE-like cation transporter